LDLITFGDIDRTTNNVESVSVSFDCASIILGGIWVSSLSADAMRLNRDVLKSMRWKTSLATMVVEILGAVNKLLLRKWSETFVLQKLMSFQSTNSRESPA